MASAGRPFNIRKSKRAVHAQAWAGNSLTTSAKARSASSSRSAPQSVAANWMR